jgi:hypothetical protein
MNFTLLAFILIAIIIAVRVVFTRENYIRALDDAYISTKNARRVSDYFNTCNPGSMDDCDRGTFPTKGLPLA